MHCSPARSSHVPVHTLHNLCPTNIPSASPNGTLEAYGPTHHCNTPAPKHIAAPASGLTPAIGLFLSRTHQTLQTEPTWHPETLNLALLPTSPSLPLLSLESPTSGPLHTLLLKLEGTSSPSPQVFSFSVYTLCSNVTLRKVFPGSSEQ